MKLILLIILTLLILHQFFIREKFGWNCTFTPNNINEYNKDWLLGGTPFEGRLDSYLK